MNEKIKIEWEKIKESDIFSSIDEFAKLFENKPYGRCFRKYTSYPWCKDNFFFGSYEELSEFYKNNSEIPFYLKTKIGAKFHNLTILDFYKDDKNVLMAKCLCDCGKIADKKWEGISDGNTRTCGCHNKKIKDSLLAMAPKIVDQYWDYERNVEKPQNISIKSTTKFWWKDSNGSYQMAPTELVKRNIGTSFPEQIILYYLKKIFQNVISRYKIKIDGKFYESDIFIEELNVAIEYDGAKWHKGKELSEIEKYQKFKSRGIFLIRIREEGLKIENVFADYNIVRYVDNVDSDVSICDVYNQMIECLNKIKPLYVKDHKLNSGALKKDKLEILKQYKIGFEEKSINDTFLKECFDFIKNKDVRPYQIPITFPLPLYFKCKKGFSLEVVPGRLLSKKEINSDCCFVGKDCPCSCDNNLQCDIYDDYKYQQIKLKYYSYNEPNIDVSILDKFNLRNYKDELKKYLSNMLEKKLSAKGTKAINDNLIETMKFVLYNSPLIDFSFMKQVAHQIIDYDTKREFVPQIFDAFYLSTHIGKSEYLALMEDIRIRQYIFSVEKKESEPQDEYNSEINYIVKHFYYLIINDCSSDVIIWILDYIRDNVSDACIYLFLYNICKNFSWHKMHNRPYDGYLMEKMLLLVKTINEDYLRGRIALYIKSLMHKNTGMIIHDISLFSKETFKNGSALTYKDDCYKYEHEYNNIKFLEEVLYALRYYYDNEINSSSDLVNIITKLIMSNPDYYQRNSNKLLCLLKALKWVLNPISIPIDKNYILSAEFLSFIKKNKMLVFLPYILKSFDTEEYMSSFCEEIKYYSDRQIGIDSDYLENEILENIDTLSNEFIIKLNKTLKYVGRERDRKDINYVGYTIIKIPKAIKALKDKVAT